MNETGTLTWTNGRGKEESRPINYTLDIREHIGEPGWALLAIAANTHLSVSDLVRLLDDLGGVERSRSWLQRRRWLFQQPGAVNAPNKTNRDGKDNWAIGMMAENPTLSVRQLVRLLAKQGISRNREWVRCHRCDG